jgi:hypothetical protein
MARIVERSVDVVDILVVDHPVVVDVGQIAGIGDVVVDARVDVIEVGAVEAATVIGIDRVLRAIDLGAINAGRDQEGDGEYEAMHGALRGRYGDEWLYDRKPSVEIVGRQV